MNNQRRQKLKEIIKRIMAIKFDLEQIVDDEELAYESMPESLQGSLNGMNSEDAIDKLGEAVICCDEIIECIEEII